MKMAAPRLLNVNVGVLGHVDSGKTSLAKAMSTVSSTAAFDKHPQSKERGITLDLGFSSLLIPTPDNLKEYTKEEQVQLTLVDCPGHASLIKTIIGGAQIIDVMLLVIDVTKGIQTQTAECIVIGEITCERLVIALNKIDLLPPDKRQAKIDKMIQKLKKTFQHTKFTDPPIVPVSAAGCTGDGTPTGVAALLSAISAAVQLKSRNAAGPLVFAVDHCFGIKGQGTIMTGTVLSGSVHVGDEVELPAYKEVRKVKSMQMFRKPVEAAQQGDRLGLCVTQFDPKLMERGVVCSPGAMPPMKLFLASVQRISFYRQAIRSRDKFHISIGHQTVTASILALFSPLDTTRPVSGIDDDDDGFDYDQEFEYNDEWDTSTNRMLCVLELQSEICARPNSLFIGSRLDTDIHANTCRLAFSGRVRRSCTERERDEFLKHTRVCKLKHRHGVVDRMQDERTLVCDGFFKKGATMDAFLGRRVQLSTGEEADITGAFGKSGKFKVAVVGDGLKDTTVARLQAAADRKKARKKAAKGKAPTATVATTRAGGDGGGDGDEDEGPIGVTLTFKRMVFDKEASMVQ
ncbi:hypothetical protein PTSG_08762 [Salpingoeca rosetta]|uniref:Selenocysteine-specific elongation factor n=1 Tax=Salpingoeca rosetta (strain ATCC 50818 / BSB-021) TaxID=946362 RepID=F2UKM1_SALR5|nr:uncharacterized protein PTSG_08762 [Salpingoeca rosetta]EGD77670.1 hypothetical protein PTSG_08762 [Salpingoeca rosetta]|eukprot:XP_004990146.1 hypothetical protein PTSG_08762 [Salpingoeca rosetta]